MISFSFCSAAIAASTTASRLDRDASSCSACMCVCAYVRAYVRVCEINVWECMSGKRETERTIALTCLSAWSGYHACEQRDNPNTHRPHLGQGTKVPGDKGPPEKKTHTQSKRTTTPRTCPKSGHTRSTREVWRTLLDGVRACGCVHDC